MTHIRVSYKYGSNIWKQEAIPHPLFMHSASGSEESERSHLLSMRWEEGTILIGQHLSLPPEYSENLTEPVTTRHSLAPFSQQEQRLWCVR